MTTQRTTLMVDKSLHKAFIAKVRASGTSVVQVINRLLEMYIQNEVVVVIPSKKV